MWFNTRGSARDGEGSGRDRGVQVEKYRAGQLDFWGKS